MSPHSRKSRSLIVSLTVCVAWIFATKPAEAVWQSFAGAEEVGDATLRTILITAAGEYWFGTLNGVRVYDGVSWSGSLPGNDVGVLVEGTDGAVWAGTYSGDIYFRSAAEWEQLDDQGTLLGTIYDLCPTGTGHLWVASERGLFDFDGSSWTRYGPSIPAQAFLMDSSGTVWAAYIDSSTWRVRDGEATQILSTSEPVSTFLEARDGAIWAGGDRRVLYRCVEGVCTEAGPSTRVNMDVLLEDDRGWIWAGGSSELWRKRPGEAEWIDESSRLPGGKVVALSKDDFGGVWAATDGSGVNRFDGIRWMQYDATEGPLSTARILALESDESGNLWLMGEGSVDRFDFADVNPVNRATEPESLDVKAVVTGSDGRVWAGFGPSLHVLEGGTWREIPDVVDAPIRALHEDRSGTLWIGTDRGLCRLDGDTCDTWITGHEINAIAVDLEDVVWAGTDGSGVVRCGQICDTLDVANSELPSDEVEAIVEQSTSGLLWFGTTSFEGDGGAASFDGKEWNVLFNDNRSSTEAILDGVNGELWLGRSNDTVVWDGSNLRVIDSTGGLALAEDGSGAVWKGTAGPILRRFAHGQWLTFGSQDGLTGTAVQTLAVDSLDHLWIGTNEGLVTFEPDRVPPLTRFLEVPPALSASATQAATFRTAFGEEQVSLEYSLDRGPWHPVSVGFWSQSNLSDGLHVLAVRGIDRFGNVERIPATTTFEIDATYPDPALTSPRLRDVVQGVIEIRGRASDTRFADFTLEVSSFPSQAEHLHVVSDEPIAEGVLYRWDTAKVADGEYEIRLSVRDSLGLVGTDRIQVIVDNEEPFVFETSPVTVNSASGGDVYTSDGEAHLFVPPMAFGEDATVTLDPLEWTESDSLAEDGARRLTAGYEVTWGMSPLEKTLVLDLSFDSVTDHDPTKEVGVYLREDASGSEWKRLGGTVDSASSWISVPIASSGEFALFVGAGAGSGAALGNLSITPRVYSRSRQSFGGNDVGIAFTLGQSSSVTVSIFSRAGRLVRRVASGRSLSAGDNIVRWDGRDESGDPTRSGLYFVAVEAQGRTRTETLAVVQ